MRWSINTVGCIINKPKTVRVEPKIKFKYVDDEDNTFIQEKKPKQVYTRAPIQTARNILTMGGRPSGIRGRTSPKGPTCPKGQVSPKRATKTGAPFFMPAPQKSDFFNLTEVDRSRISTEKRIKSKRLLRKTLSIQAIDVAPAPRKPDGPSVMLSPMVSEIENELKKSPTLYKKVQATESSMSIHKYYNIGDLKEKRKRRNISVPTTPLLVIKCEDTTIQATQPKPEVVIPSKPLELDNTDLKNNVSKPTLSKRKLNLIKIPADQRVYKINMGSVKNNKWTNSSRKRFMEIIDARQKQRRDARKAKNRKDVSKKEYIDDYFMRQLGYSVLRNKPKIATEVNPMPLEEF